MLRLLVLALACLNTATASSIHHLPVHRRSPVPLGPHERLAQLAVGQRALKAKYGLPLEEGGEQGRGRYKRQSSAEVRLAGNQGSYYTSILLGTPPVTHEVLMDTGSADLVMLTSPASPGSCVSDCRITAPLYDPSASSSAIVSDTPVSIVYGTGQADGVLVEDSASMAGFKANTSLIAVINSTDLVSSSDQSGLLGLAWRGLSQTNSTPFFQELWESDQLAEPLFAFGLAPLDALNVPDPTLVVPGGILSIGGMNTSLFSGSINYVPLTTRSSEGLYWSIPLDDIGVQGSSLGLSAPSAVIDTGTNSIAVPQRVAEAVYAAIPGSEPLRGTQGVWSYPCNTDVALALTFGGVTYTMPPQSFNTGIVSSNGRFCAGAVSSLGGEGARETFIIGSPFLFSFYSIYRFQPPSVGFATVNDSLSLLAYGAVPTSSGGEEVVSVPRASAVSEGMGTRAHWRGVLVGVAVALGVGWGV